ncbi:MAG: OmpH family outer membrane protein [Bernardetiaceae bacterium]|jgi:outer membrane protein|nr:OmpH family outer membrane protein [Bernardetiaceae bacterium]
MKTRIIALACAWLLAAPVWGQRFGYIDSQVILEKLPEYGQAERELASLTEQWKKELADKQAALLKAKVDFEAEKVLLTDDLRKQRLEEIAKKEKSLLEGQTAIFGYDGLLFKKRDELMKPLMERVFAAVEKIARKRKLSFIFDKASDLSMVFADPVHNYTENVMEELGIAERNAEASQETVNPSGGGQPTGGGKTSGTPAGGNSLGQPNPSGQTAPKTQANPNPGGQTAPKTQANPNPSGQTAPKTQANPNPGGQTAPKTQANPNPGGQTAPKTQANPSPGGQTAPKPNPQTKPSGQTAPKPNNQNSPAPKPKPQPKPNGN